MLPPRMTRSGLSVMAFHPGLNLLTHHRSSRDAVNRRGRVSGLHKPSSGSSNARLRAAVGDQRQQHRQDHEYDGSAEHPVRRVLVHDPAEQQRADDAAEIEAGGNDAEGPAGRARRALRCGPACRARGRSRRRGIRPLPSPPINSSDGRCDRRNGKHDDRVDSKAGGGDLSVTLGCGRRESRRPARRRRWSRERPSARYWRPRMIRHSRSSARPRRNCRCRRWTG